METPEINSQQEQSPSQRRDFIRNSALTAGAIAAATVAGSAHSATLVSDTSDLTSRRKTLDVSFNSTKVTQDEVFQVVKQFLELTGCDNCGFNGFDLRLKVDPVIRFNIETLATGVIQY